MKARLDHTEDVAKNIKTFWFKPEQPVNYEAGQFTQIILPHGNTDKRGDKRWFTVSSSPTEPLLSITTKHAIDHVSSFKQTLFGLKPGTEVNLADPMGDFVLPKDKAIPLVFVAAGIGVTPMRSMVKYLTDSNEKRNIHLIYAAKSQEEVAFQSLFENYGVKLNIIIGKLEADMIAKLAGPSAGKTFYLSGPEPLVEALNKDLPNFGIDPNQIITDYFPGYTTV